jgi:hypothetical protein
MITFLCSFLTVPSPSCDEWNCDHEKICAFLTHFLLTTHTGLGKICLLPTFLATCLTASPPYPLKDTVSFICTSLYLANYAMLTQVLPKIYILLLLQDVLTDSIRCSMLCLYPPDWLLLIFCMLSNICTGLGLPAFARLFGDIFVVSFIFNKNVGCIVISNFICPMIILIQIMLESLK